MRPIGFSTGALNKGDFAGALGSLKPYSFKCVELSALRMHEVSPLLGALDRLDLEDFSFISFHAPSRYERQDEAKLAAELFERVPASWPIVMHPDAIFDFNCWRPFGKRLALENMDRRKPCGRDVTELRRLFDQLPEASLCFDIGHVRQFDSSMTEAFLILTSFQERLVEVHISEVNSESQHDPISYGAKLSFQQVADLINKSVPIIVESRVPSDAISREVQNAIDALTTERLLSKETQLQGLFGGLSSIVQAFVPIGTKAVS